MALNGSSLNVSSLNSTGAQPTSDFQSLTAQWAALPKIFTVATTLSILFNCLLMLVFALDRNLHTPFNVYLINLLTANLLLSTIQNPLEIINNVYPTAFWPGPTVCTFYIYAQYVLQAGVSGAHILIAVNRTWAVLHPLSYRSIHSRWTAAALCAGMWVYIHVVLLPGVINDARLRYANSRQVITEPPNAKKSRVPLKDFAKFLNVDANEILT